MPDVDEALTQIAEIHSQIARSTRFRGFAPVPFTVIAALSALIALGQTLWPPMRVNDAVTFVATWGIVLAGITILVTVESYCRARAEHGMLADMLLGATVRCLAPFGLTMVALPIIICAYAPGAAWLVPGLWLLLMGLGGFSAAASLPPAINLASTWFFVSGIVVLVTAGSASQASPWMMGLPLGIGHGLVAAVLRSPGMKKLRP